MANLYDQSVPVMIKYLKNTSKILEKAVVYADEKGIKHDEILTFRLREDMRPLTYQIQNMSDTCKFFAVRVLNHDPITIADTETIFAELQERISRTISILESVETKSLDLNAIAHKPVIFETLSKRKLRFESGQSYLSEYVIPNFHFHCTTAYCILRHLGVPIGAFDYMNDVFHQVDDGGREIGVGKAVVV